MKNFILIGAAGYVAPRHLAAIKETGNNLLAAVDKSDSVGVLDRYFPNAAFFTEFERFDRYVSKLLLGGVEIHFLTICSPNYLHDAHIRFGLRIGANVICEKPLVLSPWNLRALSEMESRTSRKIYTILQLRLHPDLIALKKELEKEPKDKIFDVNVTYITYRGKWYFASWKGDEAKSGGIATNIGIHFFDLLCWLFGGIKSNVVHVYSHDRASGFLEMDRARVVWFLSIADNQIISNGQNGSTTTYRSIKIDGKEIEFSNNFSDLHQQSYVEILKGNGFGLEVAHDSIRATHDIRNLKSIGLVSPYHQLSEAPLTPHPFLDDDSL